MSGGGLNVFQSKRGRCTSFSFSLIISICSLLKEISSSRGFHYSKSFIKIQNLCNCTAILLFFFSLSLLLTCSLHCLQIPARKGNSHRNTNYKDARQTAKIRARLQGSSQQNLLRQYFSAIIFEIKGLPLNFSCIIFPDQQFFFTLIILLTTFSLKPCYSIYVVIFYLVRQ